LLISMVSWAAMLGEYWLMLRLLGLNLTPIQAISTLTAARIAILLPLPAGLGTLEASQVLALGALGLNPAAGISLSLLIRVRDVALGGLGLWWGGVKGAPNLLVPRHPNAGASPMPGHLNPGVDALESKSQLP